MADTAACRVVIGLPSTAAELADCIADPRGRDLLASQQLTVQHYTRQVMAPLARVLPVWREHGACVYPAATLAALAWAIHEGGPAATVFLVSHWQQSPMPAIEFFDGMAPIDAVADLFPEHFEGVVDLCICQSLALAKRIKRRCPQATVKWVNVEATPSVWFQVHTLTLRLMQAQRLDYLAALDQSLRSFQHGAR